MNRPSDSMKHISMLDADQHADTPDDCMPSRMTVTMKAIWMRFDGSMLNVFMISPLHTMALPGRARTLTGKAIPASWIVISSQTKQNWVRYDMFANVHGWIVRPRFRTVCGTMRQSSVRHALKSRVAHGYCIGCAECGRWHVRAGVRYVGMGWCWQHARDEICGATMIAVSSGGTYRTGTCRRHARLHRFTSKLRLISKKNAALSLLYCFFFFSRASHSWRRTIPEARRGMPETAICTWFVLVAGTYMKMRTYCRICMFTSEVMVLSKPEWDGFCRLDYRRSVNISIMKFEH